MGQILGLLNDLTASELGIGMTTLVDIGNAGLILVVKHRLSMLST